VHLEQTVSAGTRSVAPVTIGKLPVYIAGIPTPTIQDSAFAQSDSGHDVLIGIGAAVNAGQVATKPSVVIGEGASAWGDGAIAIGKNQQAGQSAAKDGCISIGSGGTVNAKNAIRIGSELAFGAGAGDDSIVIGTQAITGGNGAVSIGRGTTAQARSVVIGYGAGATAADCIAIGNGANTPNTGVANFVIAIGMGASAGVTAPANCSAIAIGTSASASGNSSVAIGEGATVSPSTVLHSIAIGHGATCVRTSECVIGDSVTGPITLFTVRAGANVRVKHRSGGTGGWGIRDLADANDIFAVDEDVTAGNARLFVWDCATGLLKRVTFGAGAGVAADAANKYLRVVV
jgi:hypothetical protein